MYNDVKSLSKKNIAEKQSDWLGKIILSYYFDPPRYPDHRIVVIIKPFPFERVNVKFRMTQEKIKVKISGKSEQPCGKRGS